MKNQRACFTAALIATALFGTIGSVWSQETEPSLTITDPARDGVEVGRTYMIRGVAQIPSGFHVWVLVRREDFTGVWWPQGAAPVDPKTGVWQVQATFGEAQDVGWSFDLAAVVVAESEHIRLQDYRIKAMTSGEFRPIEMPPTACAPKMLRVKKTSHGH